MFVLSEKVGRNVANMSRVPVAGETVSRIAPGTSFLFRVESVEQFANDTCEADTCVDAECRGVFEDKTR